MKVFKLLAGVLLLVGLVFLLGGCGGGSDDIEFTDEMLTYLAEPTDDIEVWMMDQDGNGKFALVENPLGDAIQGTLSPDGRKLLYLTNDSTNGTQMLVRDLNTGADTVLVTDAGDSNNDMTPAWSPDGTKIARSDSRDRDIHVMDADGTDDVVLVDDAATDISPAWNHNGTKIAWDKGWNGGIWIMDADGSNQTQVIAEGDGVVYGQPQFLPDGRIICMREDASSKDIVVMDPDGTNIVNLTPDTADSDEWSPTADANGVRIAFATDRTTATDDDSFDDVYIGRLTDDDRIVSLENLTDDVDYDCWRPHFGPLDVDYFNLD